jgi:hypothetical protein
LFCQPVKKGRFAHIGSSHDGDNRFNIHNLFLESADRCVSS